MTIGTQYDFDVWESMPEWEVDSEWMTDWLVDRSWVVGSALMFGTLVGGMLIAYFVVG